MSHVFGHIQGFWPLFILSTFCKSIPNCLFTQIFLKILKSETIKFLFNTLFIQLPFFLFSLFFLFYGKTIVSPNARFLATFYLI
jgi:hypothetical protein